MLLSFWIVGEANGYLKEKNIDSLLSGYHSLLPI
mgnify:CR=1 FL=1